MNAFINCSSNCCSSRQLQQQQHLLLFSPAIIKVIVVPNKRYNQRAAMGEFVLFSSSSLSSIVRNYHNRVTRYTTTALRFHSNYYYYYCNNNSNHQNTYQIRNVTPQRVQVFAGQMQQQQQQFKRIQQQQQLYRDHNMFFRWSTSTVRALDDTSHQTQQEQEVDDDDDDDSDDEESDEVVERRHNGDLESTSSAAVTAAFVSPIVEGIEPKTSASQQQQQLLLLSPDSIRIPFIQQQEDVSVQQQRQQQATESSTRMNVSNILSSYEMILQERSQYHFGYPYNLQYDHQSNKELQRLLQYTINNLGDPYITSNYGIHSRIFEIAVIDFFAQLWDFIPSNHHHQSEEQFGTESSSLSSSQSEQEYWGYITASGTEGNLHGMLCARECFPNGIVYTSAETHYSIFKAMKYYRMDHHIVETLPNGEINYNTFQLLIQQHKVRYGINVPIIINVNIGTTVKGAIDDIHRIVTILQNENISRDQYYIHCDGALFGLMIPFLSNQDSTTRNNNNTAQQQQQQHQGNVPTISFTKQSIDSITVSGHKMLGCPLPCGIALCRREHVDRLQQPIDYINSIDTTIMGSRNGHAAIYMWYTLRSKGYTGIQRDVYYCIELAQYLQHRILELQHEDNIENIVSGLNAYSNTVVIERPTDISFVQKWQLACCDDIAHVVIMPNITKDRIDEFVSDYKRTLQSTVRVQPLHGNSPLSQLQRQLW